MFRDERGVALPLALITMLVASLLGVSLWQYSMADALQITRQDNKMKAYYVARSGAEATAVWMKNNNGVGLVGKTSTGSLGDGTYVVEVKSVSGRVAVEATGTVGGVSEQVALALKKVSPFAPGDYLFDNAIFAESLVVLGGNVTVQGNVESKGSVTINGNAVNVTGTVNFPVNRTYPLADVPDLQDATINYNFIKTKGPGGIFPVTTGFRYGKIEASGGRHLSFYAPAGSTVEVRVDTFETRNADIHILGGGKLILYVDNTFDHKGNVHGLPSQFLVVMGPGGNVSLPIGNSVFRGYVYGPDAHVNFSGTQNFYGAIIAKTAHTQGNAGVYYQGLPNEEKPMADVLDFEPTFDIDYWVDQ